MCKSAGNIGIRGKRVVWLDVRASYAHASLALPLLHAACLARTPAPAPDWRAVSATINEPVDAVAARVAAERPEILAGTAYLFTRGLLLEVVRRVKAQFPECRVVLGGPEFLGGNEPFLRRETAVNFILRGEGERAFPELLAMLGGAVLASPKPPGEGHGPGFLFNRKVAECTGVLDVARADTPVPPADSATWCSNAKCGNATLRGCWGSEDDSPNLQGIPGLCWIDGTGAYHDNGAAVLSAAEFAAVPPPSASPFFAWDKPFVQLETSRGCANRCTFCTSGRGDPVRLLPEERVRGRLLEIRDHGVREVRILDRTFNADPGRACRLLALFRELCPETRFHLELHPAWLTDELRDALRGFPAGRLHLEVGLQTTHPGSLRACRRRGDIGKTMEGLAFLCGLRNLAVHVDLLAGLPEVAWDWLLADLERVTRLGPEEIQLETLKLLPGTPLADEAAALGIVAQPEAPYAVLRTPHMTPEELAESRRLSRLVDGFHNTAALRELVRDAVAEIPGFYAALLTELRSSGVLDGPSPLETRFVLLHAFLCPRSPQLAERLEVAWLGTGFSPARCPGGHARPWPGPPPAQAETLFRAESASAALSRDARVWVLEHAGVRHWFVFDRGVSPTRPASVHRLRM